jgi:hypothetical protein
MTRIKLIDSRVNHYRTKLDEISGDSTDPFDEQRKLKALSHILSSIFADCHDETLTYMVNEDDVKKIKI